VSPLDRHVADVGHRHADEAVPVGLDVVPPQGGVIAVGELLV